MRRNILSNHTKQQCKYESFVKKVLQLGLSDWPKFVKWTKINNDQGFGFFGFFVFNGISTFVGYLMPEPFSKKNNSSGTI